MGNCMTVVVTVTVIVITIATMAFGGIAIVRQSTTIKVVASRS